VFRTNKITEKTGKKQVPLHAQINLFGFWDEHSFLTKSGDWMCSARWGIDYESLDHAGRDYTGQAFLKPAFPVSRRIKHGFINPLQNAIIRRFRHADYSNPLVRAAVEQRAALSSTKQTASVQH